jgi:hypothetical protein
VRGWPHRSVAAVAQAALCRVGVGTRQYDGLAASRFSLREWVLGLAASEGLRVWLISPRPLQGLHAPAGIELREVEARDITRPVLPAHLDGCGCEDLNERAPSAATTSMAGRAAAADLAGRRGGRVGGRVASVATMTAAALALLSVCAVTYQPAPR